MGRADPHPPRSEGTRGKAKPRARLKPAGKPQPKAGPKSADKPKIISRKVFRDFAAI